ncbi:MAG TPA: toxin-antitoxin system YwqK family antitoxin [Bacteroidales bacterium]|nr:toxin-antitoxin system YwqK family antitoxin [Bacteroidales bacterium]HPF02830.1 toxin-antitoxin system YwqK family antitoxin [Bacteroidales bacterium]HPJ60246.1 toxin-antitoxin system YwqK family antitoxin [Bacteroidales bacterium]HPR13563.1 toxin-antitoxin system YwqK family antitoxin [Bacteroidales bacterium]HRW86446.1 toxin-antitoxin system YwqK family antitoxin [Bacteroidales bacterium]
MKKIFLLVTFFVIAFSLLQAQTEDTINITDQQGRKQGLWIKEYPNKNIMYRGTFKDDKPVGEFKRYFPDSRLRSVLIYSNNSREASATIYHSNGYIASKGKYIDQLKEGKWQFYSAYVDGWLINEESYTANVRDGQSISYYQDHTVAEKINYLKGLREGEWLRYHQNGKLFLKAFYVNDKLHGAFNTWYENGKPEYSGTYNNNARDGKWVIYDDRGAVKYEISYVNGMTEDRKIDRDAEDFFNRIEKKNDIPDPEKTGEIRW